METLRANQALLLDKAMQGKRKPAIVPFRHSKLTEMFQGFFAGQGRAVSNEYHILAWTFILHWWQVMIVNVNPYDTGFDENSHVMRFSSIAREIQTTAFNKMSMPLFRGMDALRNAVTPMKVRVPIQVLKPAKATATPTEEDFVEEELQVQEGERPMSCLTYWCWPKMTSAVDPEDDNEEDLLVQFLFGEIKELRVKVCSLVPDEGVTTNRFVNKARRSGNGKRYTRSRNQRGGFRWDGSALAAIGSHVHEATAGAGKRIRARNTVVD
jgi:kinesin family protein 20